MRWPVKIDTNVPLIRKGGRILLPGLSYLEFVSQHILRLCQGRRVAWMKDFVEITQILHHPWSFILTSHTVLVIINLGHNPNIHTLSTIYGLVHNQI